MKLTKELENKLFDLGCAQLVSVGELFGDTIHIPSFESDDGLKYPTHVNVFIGTKESINSLFDSWRDDISGDVHYNRTPEEVEEECLQDQRKKLNDLDVSDSDLILYDKIQDDLWDTEMYGLYNFEKLTPSNFFDRYLKYKAVSENGLSYLMD